VQLAHILAGKGVFCDFSMPSLTTDIHCSSCDEAILWSKLNFGGAYILLRLLWLKNEAVQRKEAKYCMHFYMIRSCIVETKRGTIVATNKLRFIPALILMCIFCTVV
jgi:hypothetical protein